MTATPHDALFKGAFCKLRHARGLLREVLPPAVVRRLDFRSLRVESGIAVGGEDLDEQRMDLLYSARAGRRRVLLYVLFEHQSKVDPWMVFRLLCYMVAIWKGFRAEHPRARKLPPILPVVMHHSRTGWTAKVAFDDLLDADADLLDALGPYVPRFRFLLDDLSRQSDAALRARSRMTPGGRVAILSLKHGRDRIAIRIKVLSPDAGAPGAMDVLTLILRYILETSRTPAGTLRGLLARQVGPKVAEEIMTTADQLRREGEAKGEAKGEARGEARGVQKVLLEQLRLRFGDLPSATVARVHKAGAPELAIWVRRVLTATSLDEVLGATKSRV